MAAGDFGPSEAARVGHGHHAHVLRKATREPARVWSPPVNLPRNHNRLHRMKAPVGYCVPGDAKNVLPWAAGEDLVTTPQHNHSLASWQRTPRPRCAVVVDRHVHKNGGSTMRDIFLENERLGYGLYQGYTQLYWRSDFPLLRRMAEVAVKSGRTPSHVLMFESHFGPMEMSAQVMGDLAELRQTYRAGGLDCRVVLVTRVREPLAYYLSFYKWGVAFRQREVRVKNAGRRPAWGHNFTDWVSQVPNLQSSVMLKGMAAMPAEYLGRMYRAHHPTWEQLDAMLSAFDLVGTTSKFDETLVLLSDLTGLPLLVYKYNRPHGKGGFRGSTAEVCPDMEYCRQVVRQSAPLDHRMWDKWGPGFDARIGSLGAEFEARVAAFKADVKAAQAAWGSAPRAQTICRYHPETSPSEKELAPANLRCPVDDGVELCRSYYAHRLFECPWQYQPNSTLTDPLGCWRPSSGFL